MAGILEIKARRSDAVSEQLGGCRAWIVFLHSMVDIYSHTSVLLLAWFTNAYIIPVYLALLFAMVTQVSDLTPWQLAEAPLLWLAPHGVRATRVRCFRLGSLALRVLVVVALVTVVEAWLKTAWWAEEARCEVDYHDYDLCLEERGEQSFIWNGFCNLYAGTCFLNQLPEWLWTVSIFLLLLGPMAAVAIATLLELLSCCCCNQATVIDKGHKVMKQEEVRDGPERELRLSTSDEPQEGSTTRGKVVFFVSTLLPFFVDVVSDVNGVIQYILTGNFFFALASVGIFLMSLRQQIRRGAAKGFLTASMESMHRGEATDDLELLMLSELSVEAPLQLLLQLYAFPFLKSSEFAVISFLLSIFLSLTSVAGAAYTLVELDLISTILVREYQVSTAVAAAAKASQDAGPRHTRSPDLSPVFKDPPLSRRIITKPQRSRRHPVRHRRDAPGALLLTAKKADKEAATGEPSLESALPTRAHNDETNSSVQCTLPGTLKDVHKESWLLRRSEDLAECARAFTE
ncbi:unnamed protein product [Durusdinium trenchii]|uniref:Solute carrier family 40 protein n=1 Tax=Durusdinium trenchii TaxID=1381693 RepID=A0ABP0HNC9_9DINO